MASPEDKAFLEDALKSAMPPEEPAVLPELATALLARKMPKLRWIFDSLIPEGGLIAISGKPGSYKTFFAIWLALRATIGESATHNHPEGKQTLTGAINALIIEEENTERTIRDRLLGFSTGDFARLHVLIDKGFSIQKENWLMELKKYITDNEISLVILDPFISTLGLRDENDNSQAAEAIDKLRKALLVDCGCAVVFLHHPNKGDESGKGLRGAGDILGKVDIHFSMEKDEDNKRKIRVEIQKNRLLPEEDCEGFCIKLEGDSDFNNLRFAYAGEVKPKGVERMEKDAITILTETVPGREYSRANMAEFLNERTDSHRFKTVFNFLQDKKLIARNATYTKRLYITTAGTNWLKNAQKLPPR